MLRFSRILAVAVVGIIIAAGAHTRADARPAPPPRNLQVMSWNMCGSLRPTWHCENTGTVRQKVDVVRYHVANSYVRAALLQEICEDALDLLLTDLGSAWSARFVPYRWSQDGVLADSPCGPVVNGNRIGTAIVVRAGLAAPVTHTITQPWTGLQRPFHCATAAYWGVRLCNAHLTPAGGNPDHPTWEYADDQLEEIRDITATHPRVVLGGDLNVNPPDRVGNTRAWLWNGGDLYASYDECDQVGPLRDGRPTHNGGWKLDYIFTGETRRWCAVADSAYSDHHVVIQSITVP